MIAWMLKKIVGSKNQREIRRLLPFVPRINELEKSYQSLTDAQLQAKTPEFKERLQRGETVDDILPEAFAVVKNTCRRLLGQTITVVGREMTWDMVPFDVQLIGGIVLHQGKIAEMANFVYIRQKGMYGNGTPVLNAKHVIGDEPFAVLWGDEFIYSNPPRLKQMMDVWDRHGKPVISGVRVPPESVDRYGIAKISDVEPGVYKIEEIVEKPSQAEAPSNLATHGAYILPPRIFELLEQAKPGKGNEIWLPDAISALAKEQDVYAVEIQNGRYYDTGNKLEYLKAVVEFGLKHEDLADDFANFLKNLKL